MKKTILKTFVVMTCLACLVLVGIFIIRNSRDNLLINNSFDLALGDKAFGWQKINALAEDQLLIEKQDGNSFAVVNTQGIEQAERNPFEKQIIGQKIEFDNTERCYSLSGKVRKATNEGVALVMLKLYGFNTKIDSDSFKLSGPMNQWVDFSITVDLPEAVQFADVVLGVHPGGIAHFDDLELVRGEPKKKDFADLATRLGILLLAFVCCYGILELVLASKEPLPGIQNGEK